MPWYGFTKYGVPDVPALESSVLTGQILLFPSSIALNEAGDAYVAGPPFGYLRCDGHEELIADYLDLYAFLTDPLNFIPSYGVPSTVDHFVLPDFQSMFPIGLNTADPNVNVIGETGGAASHAHTVASNHTHATTTHSHNVTGHLHSYPNHSTHTLPAHTHDAGGLAYTASSPDNNLFGDTTAPFDFYVAKGAHSHTISGSSGSSMGSVSNPKTGGNNDKDDTSGINGTVGTSGTSDTVLGIQSSTITLATSGGVDSIPPYYSMHFIIRT